MKNIATNSTGDTTMKRIGSVLMAASMVAVMAVSAQASGKGTSGAQFLRIGAGARGPAMGGAFSPVADDATAIYWNPAGLSLLQKREVSLGYNAYFKDTASQFLGYAHPMAHGVFGAGISLFGVQDIDKRSATGGDADAADLGSFDTTDMALSLGYGSRMAMGRGALHYGGAVKYISSDLGSKSAKTGALDLGGLYRFEEEKGLSLSLALLNLGGTLKFDEESDPLPLTLKPGLAYQMGFERMGRLTLALDSDILLNDGIALVQPGVEWWAHRMVALRTGYQFGRGEDAGGVSAGVGLLISNLSVDYAFIPYGDLGDTHRMSIGFKF